MSIIQEIRNEVAFLIDYKKKKNTPLYCCADCGTKLSLARSKKSLFCEPCFNLRMDKH